MQIKEVFSPYLNYAMFGWISPAGSIKLATPANARQSELYTHAELQSDLGLGDGYGSAFRKGWVRWYIEGDRLCFECYWVPGVKRTIMKGSQSIMKLCEDPKKFGHFAVKAPPGHKPNQAHNERILINSYELELPDEGYWQAPSLSALLNRVDREAISRDDEEEDDNW